MRLEVVHPQSPSFAEAQRTMRLINELGFDGVWVSEVANYDAFALAGRLAVESDGQRLVVGPLAATARSAAQHAMGLASLWAFGVDAELVIGASSPTVVEGWHGRQKARVADLEFLLGEVPRILSGAVGTRPDGIGRGGFRLGLEGRPTRVGLAGLGPRTLALAARKSGRIVLNNVTPARVSELLVELSAVASEDGLALPSVTVWVKVGVDAGPEVREQARSFLARYVKAPGYRQNFAAQGFSEVIERSARAGSFAEIVHVVPDEFVDAFFVNGSADAVLGRVAEYLRLGVDVAVVPSIWGDPSGDRSLRALSELAQDLPVRHQGGNAPAGRENQPCPDGGT